MSKSSISVQNKIQRQVEDILAKKKMTFMSQIPGYAHWDKELEKCVNSELDTT